MPRIARALAVGLVVGAAVTGCGGGKRTASAPVVPEPPPTLPETWDVSTPEARAAGRELAMAACAWYLDTAPATADGKQWSRVRDYALDWIEASREPTITVVQPIVAYVATDRSYMYAAYMRGAYQCGKAEYLLAHPPASPEAFSIEAEVAGVTAMQRLFAAIAQWDPSSKSKRLRKLERRRARGKLEPHLTKIMVKASKKRR